MVTGLFAGSICILAGLAGILSGYLLSRRMYIGAAMGAIDKFTDELIVPTVIYSLDLEEENRNLIRQLKEVDTSE